MGTKVTPFSTFQPDETGIFNGISGSTASHNIYFNLQKSSINTVESVCFSPFGQVSNINCPDWDPACNCYINQYKPKELPKTDKELIELKQATSECAAIDFHLIKKFNHPYWFGVDFSNPKCPYNCFSEEFTNPRGGYDPAFFKDVDIKYHGITGEITKNSFYPYSMGYYGNSGPVLGSDLKPLSSSSDNFVWQNENPIPLEYTVPEVTDTNKSHNTTINNPLFGAYLEYSKTNATFWGTPPKTPLLRNALMNLYTFQKIKITVNGSFLVKIGNLVNVQIPIKDQLGERGKGLSDKRFAGTWMVYRIERTITGGKHTMVLYLMRDGYFTDKYSTPSLNTYGRKIIKQNSGNSNTP
jgi:hypothetical protein